MTIPAKSAPLMTRRSSNRGLVAVADGPLDMPRINRRLSSVLQVFVLAAADVTALLIAAIAAYGGWAFLVLKQPLWLYSQLVPLLVMFPLV